MLMPKALQARLPRIFGEPEDDVATGDSIWGMITKTEEGAGLSTRPSELEPPLEDPRPATSRTRDSDRDLWLEEPMGGAQPEPVESAQPQKPLSSPDRLLSTMNQIPPSKDRSVPRRAGVPFPPRPKSERPTRPPKVTMQKSTLPPSVKAPTDFAGVLTLGAGDLQADVPAIEGAPVTVQNPVAAKPASRLPSLWQTTPVDAAPSPQAPGRSKVKEPPAEVVKKPPLAFEPIKVEPTRIEPSIFQPTGRRASG